jgi:hypothetical protein
VPVLNLEYLYAWVLLHHIISVILSYNFIGPYSDLFYISLISLLLLNVEIVLSLDWAAITGKKNLVKSSDQKPCGNIIAEYNDNFFVIRGEAVKLSQYMIPKIMMVMNYFLMCHMMS